MDPIKVSQDTIRTRPKLIKKMRLVMFLGLIGGPIVFGIGLFQYLQTKSLKTKGLTVEAQVQETSIFNTGKGRSVYKVVADYHPEGRPIHRKEFVVRQDEYEKAETTKKIPVTFLPSDPSVSAAGAEVHPDNEPMAIGAGVFVVAFLIWLYFRRKSKEIDEAIFGKAQPPPRN
jgi:hypothetical protein